jgi:hypothetical protein
MSLTKICIGNIGEHIQCWEYWDQWGDIGELCCVLKNAYQILGTRFSNGHVEISGAILVNRVMELCHPLKMNIKYWALDSAWRQTPTHPLGEIANPSS